MRLSLVLVFILMSFYSWAQKTTLSGRVVDKNTGEPLALASIVFKGKPVGTIANLEGEFDFHFPTEYRNDILVISMLGYGSFEAPVWSLLDGTVKTIQLAKSLTMLNEVVVTDSLSLSGGEIFSVALARIDQNFPMQPFLLTGFYRDVKKVGGTYIALLEAAVKIYDENYTEPRNKEKLRERVKLVEVRKSLGYENKFTAYFGQENLLEDLLLHNNIRYRQIDAREEFLEKMKRENDSYYNGHDVFVVSNKEDFNLKVYIDKEDFSILHLEFERSDKGENLAIKKNLVSKFIGYKKIIDFRKFEGKMYLNYIRVMSRESWYDKTTNTLKFETELVQDLLINEVHPNTNDRIGPTEKMRNYGLQYQDYPYNKKFWEDYNVIKETPIDKQILLDLEKVAPLEKQFEDDY